MTTAVVSSYPPERCGVASFTAQAVRRLRDAGESVRVLTWGAGDGDFRLDGPPVGGAVLRFLPQCRGADRVILHYLPDFYLDLGGPAGQVRSRLALRRFLRAAPAVEVFMHDPPWYPSLEELSWRGRLLWRLDQWQFAAASRIVFHNQVAVDIFRKRFRLPAARLSIAAHGSDFEPNYRGSRETARVELGIAAARTVFVSPGFISPRKGYELAIEALSHAPELDCDYVIVGSPHPKAGAADEAYVRSLQESSAADPRVRLRVEFVDDASFDRWLLAADAVLIPSRFASSSSVLARAHLMGVPAVTTDEPGLVAEHLPGDRSIANAGELAAVLAEFCGRRSRSAA